MRDDFAVLILSHGRADRVLTVDSLHKCGYTGKYYIIIDNEDDQTEQYNELYSGHIIVFDKFQESLKNDTCDLNPARNIVLHARNVCHKIAKDLGLTYFLELDDDYCEFRCRYEDESGKFCTIYVRDFDSIVNCMLEFLDASGAHTVAFAQTGDFIGGKGSNVWKRRLARKAMNSFFCRVDRPFDFIGRINEDTTAYVLHGSRGKLFFTIRDVSLDQCTTQAYSGGLTEAYLDNGTYVKSFYTVMNCPSSVKVAAMGVSNKRYHHLINWDNATPKIISEDFKKEEKNETHNQHKPVTGTGNKSNKGLF